MRNYYYLIAGLADISFDEGRLPYSPQEFISEISAAVSAKDRELLNLLLLENDCRNLMSLLEKGSVENALPGVYGIEVLEQLVQNVKADDIQPSDNPWMARFASGYLGDGGKEKGRFALDALLSAYYEYALSSDNAFVRDWFRFNLDLNNVQTAFTARKYGLDVHSLILGSGEVADALRTSGARDWGLSQVLPYFDELSRIQEEPDLAVREHRIDMLKWNWLEENTFFHYFTVERLFSYVAKLGMIERWERLDKESGQRLLRRLISELKGQVAVPDEFRNN